MKIKQFLKSIKMLITNNQLGSVIILFVFLLVGVSICDGLGFKKPGTFCERNSYRATFLIDIFPKLTDDLSEIPITGIRLPATIYRVKYDVNDIIPLFKGLYVEKVYFRDGITQLNFSNYSCHLSKMNLWEKINFHLKNRIWFSDTERFEGSCLDQAGKEYWIEFTGTEYFGKVDSR